MWITEHSIFQPFILLLVMLTVKLYLWHIHSHRQHRSVGGVDARTTCIIPRFLDYQHCKTSKPPSWPPQHRRYVGSPCVELGCEIGQYNIVPVNTLHYLGEKIPGFCQVQPSYLHIWDMKGTNIYTKIRHWSRTAYRISPNISLSNQLSSELWTDSSY